MSQAAGNGVAWAGVAGDAVVAGWCSVGSAAVGADQAPGDGAELATLTASTGVEMCAAGTRSGCVVWGVTGVNPASGTSSALVAAPGEGSAATGAGVNADAVSGVAGASPDPAR